MTLNRTIAFGITLGAAFITAAFAVALAPANPVSPAGAPGTKPGFRYIPPPLFPATQLPPDTLVGNVVSVSAAQKIIIVGDYHIENGKSVFVSSKTVHFSDATTFVQSAYVSAREPIEAGIAVSDIQERSLVRITLEPAGMAPEVLMAKRVNVLKAPNISEPPPAVKKYIP